MMVMTPGMPTSAAEAPRGIDQDRPADGLYVKGIRNTMRRARVVGGGELTQRRFLRAEWANQPGIVIVDLPEAAMDPDATVVKLELDGPIQLTE